MSRLCDKKVVLNNLPNTSKSKIKHENNNIIILNNLNFL